VTSGNKNTILGAYNGNQGGLDIRTSSNNIVLSDGDGNVRAHCDSSGTWTGVGSSTTAGAVGTYVMAGGLSFTSQFNTTKAGSSLRPRNVVDHGTYGYLTGTWRCMGFHQYETNWNAGNTTIWVRIS
jgi:hypothetical protein